MYSQKIEQLTEDDESKYIEKIYSFKKDSKILVQQKLQLGFIKKQRKEEILKQSGFTFLSIHESQKFHIYKKLLSHKN